MTVFQVFEIKECKFYSRNGVDVAICETPSGKQFITIASKMLAYHIAPDMEAIWLTIEPERYAREVYIRHDLGYVEIVDYELDRDGSVRYEKNSELVPITSARARELLRELEEIADVLLDKAAILVVSKSRDPGDTC
jgi:hypothetical protein